MISVFLLQWQRFRRAPFLVLSMLGMTIVFIMVMAGANTGGSLTIPAYSDSSLDETQQAEWLSALNGSDEVQFELMPQNEARQKVADGSAAMALQLMADDYRLLVVADDPASFEVESYINQVYTQELSIRGLEQQGATGDVRERIDRLLAEPPLTVETASLDGEAESFVYDSQLQMLFGMSLFFAVYTILFSLKKIVEEKQFGTWNRMILSPLKKWQIYLGHMAYSFSIGFIQILLVFLLFKFVFKFDIGNQFGLLLLIVSAYLFAIVALGMLVMGLVQTPQQLQATIPILATGMAMIGGAFWPIELVSNNILIGISKMLPITYGLDALKSVAIHGNGILAVIGPMMRMLLIGVLLMAAGIGVMERKRG